MTKRGNKRHLKQDFGSSYGLRGVKWREEEVASERGADEAKWGTTETERGREGRGSARAKECCGRYVTQVVYNRRVTREHGNSRGGGGWGGRKEGRKDGERGETQG